MLMYTRVYVMYVYVYKNSFLLVVFLPQEMLANR
jgi:hypothetical protein